MPDKKRCPCDDCSGVENCPHKPSCIHCTHAVCGSLPPGKCDILGITVVEKFFCAAFRPVKGREWRCPLKAVRVAVEAIREAAKGVKDANECHDCPPVYAALNDLDGAIQAAFDAMGGAPHETELCASLVPPQLIVSVTMAKKSLHATRGCLIGVTKDGKGKVQSRYTKRTIGRFIEWLDQDLRTAKILVMGMMR